MFSREARLSVSKLHHDMVSSFLTALWELRIESKFNRCMDPQNANDGEKIEVVRWATKCSIFCFACTKCTCLFSKYSRLNARISSGLARITSFYQQGTILVPGTMGKVAIGE